MSARRRARIAPETTLLMESPAWPLRLLMLGLEGLQARGVEDGLDREDMRRLLPPLIILVSDMEDAMQRGETARRAVPKVAKVKPAGEEA